MSRIADDINHRFAHHPPRNRTEIRQHEAVREKLRACAQELAELTPVCREQSLMLTHLEEAMMWANAALARHRPEDTAEAP